MPQCIPVCTWNKLNKQYYKINKYISVNYVKHPFILNYSWIVAVAHLSYNLLNKYTAQEIPQWLLTHLFAPNR